MTTIQQTNIKNVCITKSTIQTYMYASQYDYHVSIQALWFWYSLILARLQLLFITMPLPLDTLSFYDFRNMFFFLCHRIAILLFQKAIKAAQQRIQACSSGEFTSLESWYSHSYRKCRQLYRAFQLDESTNNTDKTCWKYVSIHFIKQILRPHSRGSVIDILDKLKRQQFH